MGKFSSAQSQSASVIKELQASEIKSVGTARNYEQSLTRAAEYAIEEHIKGGLRGMTPENAVNHLEVRGQEVGQKTLNMERQALQKMMQKVTHELSLKQTLPIVKSELEQCLVSRAYTPEQVTEISEHQTPKHSLSTEIAYEAGLRAHELITIQKLENQPVDQRDDKPQLEHKFEGRNGVSYSVQGKGGLTREVRLTPELSARLEERSIPVRDVIDRGVEYKQYYDIGGGHNWSNSFSAASNRSLGFSNGGHGVRHSYAQERMHELQKAGLERELALETVSQEMGHFRPDITEVYLR